MPRLVRTGSVLALALGLGCATPQPPPGASSVPPPPAPAPSPRTSPPPPPAEIPSPPPQRLAWVSPSRCLSPCAYDPTPDLVAVDGGGREDPNGAHRVAREIVRPLQELLAAAAAAGYAVGINSAFRPYDEQARLYGSIKQPGRAALPGQSEHQLGTAVDLKLPAPEAAEWLAAHAAEFGFVRSYPPGKHKITGYRPEPWHVRFVGRPLADQARSAGTLEELFRSRPELGVSGSCEDCPARARRKPCGHITAAGTCKGPLLSWCYDGALATVDCSAFSQRCTTVGEAHDCQ
jgi:D-alanyl-D-alanine carboxypeptidase